MRVREASDKLTKLLKELIDSSGTFNRLIVEAGDLKASGSLRKFFESSSKAAAIACYQPETADLERLARGRLVEAGKKLHPDAARFLAERLPRDSLGAEREIEKILLYLGERAECTYDDVTQLIGDGAEAEMDEPVLAAADGNAMEADRLVRKTVASGIAPIALLRTAQYHFKRLAVVLAAMDEGDRLDAAMKKLRPPVFFKVQNRFKAQVGRWSMAQIERAMGKLTEAERLSKMTEHDPEGIVRHVLFEISWRGDKRNP